MVYVRCDVVRDQDPHAVNCASCKDRKAKWCAKVSHKVRALICAACTDKILRSILDGAAPCDLTPLPPKRGR